MSSPKGAGVAFAPALGNGTYVRVASADEPIVPEQFSLAEPLPDPAFVYAIGRVEPRFPSLGVEKELAQATGRSDSSGLTDRQAAHAVLSSRENRYLVRQLNWVVTIEGLETYLLVPRDPSDLDLLVDALRPLPTGDDIDVVIGILGPIPPPEVAGGWAIPMLACEHIYSFDVDALIEALPRPDGISAQEFEPTAREVFSRLVQVADNAGATDEHRALNYLAVRYPNMYAAVADAHGRDASLAAVDVAPSRLTGVRKIFDVIFTFRHRQTDVEESWFVRVDVTEMFPFLVTKLTPYFRR
jgi:hypothetical protein